MNDTVPPPTSVPPRNPPEVFYQSGRSYRTRRSVIMIAVGLLGATPFLLGVVNHLTGKSSGESSVPLMYLGAAFFLLPAVLIARNAILNVREVFEINSEGIRSRHNFWYWSQVKGLKPAKVNFEARYYIRVDLHVDPRVCLLQPDVAMAPRQYAEFLGRVKPFLDAQHPAVKLEGLP